MREAPPRTREKTSGTQGNVYRSRVWITLLLVRVGFVNMMWEGQQNLSMSVQGYGTLCLQNLSVKITITRKQVYIHLSTCRHFRVNHLSYKYRD